MLYSLIVVHYYASWHIAKAAAGILHDRRSERRTRAHERSARRAQGGLIRLVRRVSFTSYGAYADGIVTTARRSASAAGSDQVLVTFPESDYTLSRLREWDLVEVSDDRVTAYRELFAPC
jgi:hypothetical protein